MPHNSENNVSGSQTTTPSFRRPQVSPLPPLEIDGDRADNWKLWKPRWKNYCIIVGLNSQPEDYKCAILEHSIGIEAIRLYNGMKFSEGEDRNRMADILAKYDQYFLDQTQEFFERFSSAAEIKLLVSQLMSIFLSCEICLERVASVTASVIC